MTDLEALAVTFAIRRFHMFIYGFPTMVLMDHEPLTALFERNNVSTLLRWALEMQRYNLEIKYVKGKTNVVASYVKGKKNVVALSRETAELGNMDSMLGVHVAEVNKVQMPQSGCRSFDKIRILEKL